MDKMKRRDALKAIGMAAVAGGLFFHRCRNADRTSTALKLDVVDGRERWERERMAQLNAHTFFDERERETITQLVDLILPADAKSPAASEVGVPDFIEFIVKDRPELQRPMRDGLKWLDGYANGQFQAPFADLPPERKTDILDRIAYPEPASAELEDGRAFFALLRQLTASGYFTSEAGINYLGYVGNRPNVWEGVPQDILRQYRLTTAELPPM